jgi:hypothetical protein
MQAGYKLFFEDSRHALRDVIENGKGYKATALHLWHTMNPDSAYARLKACTKDGGDQKLEFDEGIAVMLFNERFDVLMHICDRCHHDRPAQRAPADLQHEIVQTIEHATETLDRALAALRRLEGESLAEVVPAKMGRAA